MRMRFVLRLLTAAATLVLVAAAGCAANNVFPMAFAVTPLGLDPVMPTPIENVPTRVKQELGRRLFFDPMLSLDGTRSCSSCHRPDRAFSDSSAVSLGIGDNPTRRNAPALINRAWGASLFRDGRAASLEEAVLQPVFNQTELGLTPALLEARLNADADYRRRFQDAFGDGAAATTAWTAAALATFIRSLQSGDAPIDRFKSGDSTALTPLQKEGRALFFGRARCASCHVGPGFTDEAFHNTGVAVRSGDPGRSGVTGRPEQLGAFRTPTLRDVALTAPYMHDGSLLTLEQVIDFYDQGGEPNANLDFVIAPLRLSAREKEALIAFLQALTGSARLGR
jgi:cytochrome c peroxidase